MSLFNDAHGDGARISRVRIKNYKSIGYCDVTLGALNILVGRNGSGKSNFLDAIRFVVDGLQSSLDQAVRVRGGINDVRRRSTGHPHNLSIAIELTISEFRTAEYAFEVAAESRGAFRVSNERLRVRDGAGTNLAYYAVSNGKATNGSPDVVPAVAPDRLFLVAASSLPDFRPVYDALVAIGVYNLNPEAMKEPQTPDAGELLHRDGGNIASVIARLAIERPASIARITDFLKRIVPGIVQVERIPLGPYETLEFRQEVEGAKHPWRFYSKSMSDGTLRALGALTAIKQFASPQSRVTMVGIEEPETALHAAAAGALMNALSEAAEETQVIVTTHSPDLLEQLDLDRHNMLVAESWKGTTVIAGPDDASTSSIRDHLYSAGELLRMDQLTPSRKRLKEQQEDQGFFAFNPPEDLSE